jgi:hypothetical protein
MADGTRPYPPAPAHVPSDPTTPTPSYRFRVLVPTNLFPFAFFFLDWSSVRDSIFRGKPKSRDKLPQCT